MFGEGLQIDNFRILVDIELQAERFSLHVEIEGCNL